MISTSEYYEKCRDFSRRVAEASKGAKDLLEQDPELDVLGNSKKYWDLHNEAVNAALQWATFSENHDQPAKWG